MDQISFVYMTMAFDLNPYLVRYFLADYFPFVVATLW